MVYEKKVWPPYLESSHSKLGYNDFNNLVLLPGRWWFQNLILRHIDKEKFFSFFFSKMSYELQKTKNLMLISNLLKKLQKNSCEKSN